MDEQKTYFQVDAYAEDLVLDSASKPNPYARAEWNGAMPRKRCRKVDIGLFTMVPRHLFGSGMAARLGPATLGLYVALCEHANRRGNNTFTASDDALACDIGIAPRTICNARKKLLEHRLVKGTTVPGRSFLYTLLPQAFERKNVDLRPRPKRKPRGYGALSKPTEA